MEPPKHRCDTQVCTSPAGTAGPSSTAFVVETPIRNWATFADPEAAEMGGDRLRPLSSRTAGLKPMSDGTRRMPPFGFPKREGQPERTSRSTGGVASSQIDPPQGGTGARVQRHRRWRGHSPLRLLECMADPASLGSVPPPTALREVRLNGFPEALAEVLRHRTGGGRRVADAVPTGFSDARFVVQPAYSARCMELANACKRATWEFRGANSRRMIPAGRDFSREPFCGLPAPS